MRVSVSGGYSAPNLANSPLAKVTPIYLAGNGQLETVPKFDSETRRPIPNTVEKTRVEVYYPGFGTMKISLPADYKLPKLDDLAEIELIQGEAYINRYGEMYIRAQGITVA
ncbi:hypothetical protein EFL87_06760 [Weissella confusa]|uniref:hypothetical protein n=1 Tax=Weissella confusa TaxID=1583 RepID=UPI00223BFC7E|nr:hypothetical protein [Weissella confusa]MCT0042175.1 hypothetical protein [Weissella confusa]